MGFICPISQILLKFASIGGSAFDSSFASSQFCSQKCKNQFNVYKSRRNNNMKIAICDDMPDQLKLIHALTNEYIEQKGLAAEVHTFSHPDKLLTACETERFHIYLLDMVMPMIHGVELGRNIRRSDREAQIVYITTAPEYALESFAANPVNYLLKPLDKKAFFDTLTLAVSKIDVSDEHTFPVKTKDGMHVLSYSSIVCCKRDGLAVKFLLTSGETVKSVSIRGSFSEYIAPLLFDRRFLQPHISYVVNMNRVEGISDKEFTMRGGMCVPIAQKQYAEVRKAYFDYMLEGGKSLCR
ncbi:MAG: LytTR family DNA-binding domain-containing protein [Bacillota bacterium]|nr:LytTR family DNA-binding domain-containing protein [Bacillota bacterium]